MLLLLVGGHDGCRRVDGRRLSISCGLAGWVVLDGSSICCSCSCTCLSTDCEAVSSNVDSWPVVLFREDACSIDGFRICTSFGNGKAFAVAGCMVIDGSTDGDEGWSNVDSRLFGC